MRFDRKQLLLYGVTDRSWLNGQTLYEQVRQALEGRCVLFSFAEKSFGAGIFERRQKRYKNCAGSTRCRLSLMTTWILHWRLMRTVCMSDRMYGGREVRKRLGEDKIIGVSAHSVEEALRAEKCGATPWPGAVFGSGTKKDVER